MRYSVEPEYRKYVKGYRFLSFARRLGDKYGKSFAKKLGDKGKSIISSAKTKKLMNVATQTGKGFGKIAGKRIVQKSAEATGDLVANKIADKITSLGKPKNKKEKDEENVMEETQEWYIPPEKREQIIRDLKLFSIYL